MAVDGNKQLFKHFASPDVLYLNTTTADETPVRVLFMERKKVTKTPPKKHKTNKLEHHFTPLCIFNAVSHSLENMQRICPMRLSMCCEMLLYFVLALLAVRKKNMFNCLAFLFLKNNLTDLLNYESCASFLSGLIRVHPNLPVDAESDCEDTFMPVMFAAVTNLNFRCCLFLTLCG
ncbi:hypothetical protein E3U43_006418 [Larimichthys crocea]|uniref:Uncharacterized protein n=1 Tax=Larimichthys crocea TaxID=215358 RepID=A0ACD3RKM0_LARCR|nr:hypothetical protein E3U43_006418 [Larimichthys crocea]